MKISDLRMIEGMVRERDTLLKFINSEARARYIGIYIPSQYDVEMFRPSEACHVHLEDKPTIDAVMALTIPAACKRVADIEAELTKVGVEYDR
jgi:hypothetical protein